MSILLDALKKSEAQRQLGQAPTLQTPMPSEFSAENFTGTWIPALMLVLSAGLIWWIGHAQYQFPDSVTSPATLVTSGDTGRAAVALSGPGPSPGGELQRPAGTPVMDFTEPNEPPASGNEASAESQTDNGEAQAPTVVAARPETAIKLREAQEQGSTGSKAAATPVPERTKRPPATRRKPEQEAQPYEAESVSYWQVPQSVREDMPEMHITVLVYAEKPSDRFLLVNGQRLHEHEELSEGLVLEEIRRDRAVFSYRSYRFHLKN